MKLEEILKSTAYPGRGIIIGRTPDNNKTAAAYFITGRSENTKNRILTETANGVRTEAFDPAKLTDPSLVIYNAVCRCNGLTIITNGDQTDTIAEYLTSGRGFEDALRTRTFEPDSLLTPRISGFISENGAYKLSILKSHKGNPAHVLRFFYEYAEPVPGYGHLIHTYADGGEPVPSFEGEPLCVEIEPDLDTFASSVWNSLNDDRKIAAYVCFTCLESGKREDRIINKLGGKNGTN